MPLSAYLILADAATTEANGKINVLGGTWTITGRPVPSFTLVCLVDLPASYADATLDVTATLHRADNGELVRISGPEDVPIEISGIVGPVARGIGPDGLGIPISMALPVPAGLPLDADQTYEWRLTLDGEIAASRRFYIEGDTERLLEHSRMQPPQS